MADIRLLALVCGVVLGAAPVAVGAAFDANDPGATPQPLPAARYPGSEPGPGTLPDRGPDPGPDPGPTEAPEPKPAIGDAEAAPASQHPPSAPPPLPIGGAASAVDAWRQGPRHRIAVMPRYVHRLSGPGLAVTPSSGFGIAGTIEIAYLRAVAGLEAALGIDFSYDRFASGEVASVAFDSMPKTFRVTSETSFVLVHTASARVGRMRPYLSVGAGVGIGYFDSAAPELNPGTANDAHALGRVSAGLDMTMARVWSASIRADYTAVRGISSLVTSTGDRLALFGDLFGLGAGLAYRF